MDKIELEQYFEGDEAWETYAKLFDHPFGNSEIERRLLALCKEQQDLAKVIYFHLGDRCLEWMHSEVQVLDNITPLACLEDSKLTERLKVCLSTFPT